MKTLRAVLLILLATGSTTVLHGQYVADPLTLQGIDNGVLMSARSRAMGSAGVSTGNDATVLFSNPAALARLRKVEFRVGASYKSTTYKQDQIWIPDRKYAGLSVMFENDFTGIKDSALEKPFDDITPDWENTTSSFRPSLGVVAVPFEIGDASLTFGAGISQSIDADYYFQNLNALDPNIGAFRPEPYLNIRQGDSLQVQWFQFSSERSGAVYGITPGLAARLTAELSFGVSATILTGTIDDTERLADRGMVTLRTNNSGSYNVFSVVPSPSTIASAGTSKIRGTYFTIGVTYSERYFSAAATVRPATTLHRYWKRENTVTKQGGTSTENLDGTDEMTLPWMYVLGFALHPNERWNLGIDYQVRNYNNVEVHNGSGTMNPWLGGQVLHVGGEFIPMQWLALRAGYREVVQTFAPAGASLMSDPVRGSAYSAGAGVRWSALTFDLAYEYFRMTYEDAWISNINGNEQQSHQLLFEIGYSF